MKARKRKAETAGRRVRQIGLGPVLLLLFFPGLARSAEISTGGSKTLASQQVFSGLRALSPLPAQDAWSIQRRLESLGDEEFLRTGREWVQDMGEPARQALLLCAGSTPSPGLSISGRERRERLTVLALQIVREGLDSEQDSKAWRSMLLGAFAFREQSQDQSDSPLGGQGALAAVHVVGALNLVQYSDPVAAYMLESEASDGEADESLATPNPSQRFAFLLHDESQACLFRLYGVWFASRQEFMSFPRPPAGQAELFRKAFASSAHREALLALQLLEAVPESGLDLLQRPDPILRGEAVERLIRAVGEQSMTASRVRQVLATSVLRESNPDVSNAMLNGLLDLSLAAKPDSQAVKDLRTTLQECSQGAPIYMVPSLLSALERLPRPEGEAGRHATGLDGNAANALLESLWNPVLRLDRDTTILALRAWSRVQTKLSGFEVSTAYRQRAGAHVLRLMGDSSEPERVRLVAAEALVGWPLDKEAMGQVLQTLASPESTAHLRRAAYPLIMAGLERLPWQDLDGAGLIDSLRRDMGHGDVDLRDHAVRIASHELLLNRLSALEAAQGCVLPACLDLLENESSKQVRSGLMDLMIALAGDTGRAELLAVHLQRPIASEWVVTDAVDLAHLAKTYQALAGKGQAALIAKAGLAWVRDSQEGARANEVRKAALDMILALNEEDARSLSLGSHRALHDMALEHLLRSSRVSALEWSVNHGQRILSVHLEALASAPPGEGEVERWKQTAYLTAKLLAAAVSEDDAAVRNAFDAALAQSPNDPQQRLLVLRDRARFMGALGKLDNAKAEWVRLARWMSTQPVQIHPTDGQLGLDFEDLGHMTSAAISEDLFRLSCRVWQMRCADAEWKSLGPGACLRELESWAEAVEATKVPAILDPWLEFVESQVLLAGKEAGWLKLPESKLASFGERVARLRGLRIEWEAVVGTEGGEVAPGTQGTEEQSEPQDPNGVGDGPDPEESRGGEPAGDSSDPQLRR